MSNVTPAPQPSGGQLLEPAQAQTVRRKADLIRATALLLVAGGKINVWGVLQSASVPAGRPLLRLSLRQLLLAQPGVGSRSEEHLLGSLLNRLGLPMGHKSPGTSGLTVQWLLDPRTNGRRMLAFIDVMYDRGGGPPWPGFPFAPPPSLADTPVILGVFT